VADARMRRSSDQPNRKPVSRPHPSRRYTYHPPVAGNDAASSATESAPHSAITPPTSQTPSIADALGTRAAIVAGVRKIPEPIVMPITMPTELQKPRRRLSPSPTLTDVLTVIRDGTSVREDRHRSCSRLPFAGRISRSGSTRPKVRLCKNTFREENERGCCSDESWR